MTSLILGIDPDMGGALAWINESDGALVELIDMPVLQLKSKRELDVCQIATLIDCWGPRTGYAFIEKSGMRPGQGVYGTWVTAHNYGALVGVLRANFLLVREVAPTTWKKGMKVSSDKGEARKEASQHWPKEAGRFARVKDHGRAEAALIALYGRRRLFSREGVAA